MDTFWRYPEHRGLPTCWWKVKNNWISCSAAYETKSWFAYTLILELKILFHEYLDGKDPEFTKSSTIYVKLYLVRHWKISDMKPWSISLNKYFDVSLYINSRFTAEELSSLHSWPNRMNLRFSISYCKATAPIRSRATHVLVFLPIPWIVFRHRRWDRSIARISDCRTSHHSSQPYKALGKTTESYIRLRVRGCNSVSQKAEFKSPKNIFLIFDADSCTFSFIFIYLLQTIPRWV